MTAEQVKAKMREVRAALEARDVERVMSLFADDAVWQTPEGTFKGKEAIRRYVSWNMKTSPELKMTETGVKILAENDAGAYEHVLSGIADGVRWETLGLCIYEFANDKVKGMRSVYDRLAIAHQVAKGSIAKMAVNGVVKRMEEGLR